jgi:hypothetical protein
MARPEESRTTTSRLIWRTKAAGSTGVWLAVIRW